MSASSSSSHHHKHEPPPSSISGSRGYDYILKLIIVGDMDTGKSCVLHQFIQGTFRAGPPKHTIGVEFGSRVVALNGKTIKLQIWDTAGQERFRSVTHSYYRGAVGALVVYDVTKKSSFDSIPTWISDVRQLAGHDVSIIVCGNKCDLESERAVQLLQGSRYAQENDAMFLETSALNGNNVSEAFFRCARRILNRIDEGELDGTSPQFHGGPAPIASRSSLAGGAGKKNGVGADAPDASSAGSCAC
jgi:Ras-related protein Rab-4B